jgi:type I restriction enzyme M protein
MSAIYGIVIGDIVGNARERGVAELVTANSRITDDTITAMATVSCMASGLGRREEFGKTYQEWVVRYPDAGWSAEMIQWAKSPEAPVSMEGSCAGIRAIVIALLYDDMEKVNLLLDAAIKCTHSEDVYSLTKSLVYTVFAMKSGDDPARTLAKVSEYCPMVKLFNESHYSEAPNMDMSLWWTIAPAIVLSLTSKDYTDLFSRILKFGGDTTSIAAMAGGIAQARWGISGLTPEMVEAVERNKHLLALEEDRVAYEELCGVNL